MTGTDLTERNFLVTGVSKGIGRALSNRLAAASRHVAGIARGKDPDFPGTLVSVDLDDTQASEDAFRELAQLYSFDGVISNDDGEPAPIISPFRRKSKTGSGCPWTVMTNDGSRCQS